MNIEEYYSNLNGIFLINLDKLTKYGLILDLNSLPTEPLNYKEVLIKWLIHVNLTRLNSGKDPVITFDLVSKCPLWKSVKMPIKRLQLTPEGLFNSVNSPKKINSGSKIGSINKRKKL